MHTKWWDLCCNQLLQLVKFHWWPESTLMVPLLCIWLQRAEVESLGRFHHLKHLRQMVCQQPTKAVTRCNRLEMAEIIRKRYRQMSLNSSRVMDIPSFCPISWNSETCHFREKQCKFTRNYRWFGSQLYKVIWRWIVLCLGLCRDGLAQRPRKCGNQKQPGFATCRRCHSCLLGVIFRWQIRTSIPLDAPNPKQQKMCWCVWLCLFITACSWWEDVPRVWSLHKCRVPQHKG